MANRVAPGGASTISLGTSDPKEAYNQWDEEHKVSHETPDATPRFSQAPGGNASIALGGEAAGTCADPVSGTRGPVGGIATVVLGSDHSASRFDDKRSEAAAACRAAAEAPEAAPRFPQAPGGNATIILGGAPLDAVDPRGPVGGASTVVLGTDDTRAYFYPEEQSREGDGAPLAAAPRFQQAPGGTSSISLGEEGAAGAPCPPDVRGPVGGAVSITLGSDSLSEAFAQRREERGAAVDTPAAAPRFQQAPGGAASISLGSAGPAAEPAADSGALRPPVGGRAVVVLGSDDTEGILSQYQAQRGAGIDTPDAAPRFSQAPGGASSVRLGPSDKATEAVPVRGPVGGATTICLSADGAVLAPISEEPSTRVPAGGAATVILGVDSARDAFEERREAREAPVETPDAAPRFQQAPGGTASICLAGGTAADAATAPRGPVGGAATLVLGSADYAKALGQRQAQRGSPVETPVATPRFSQAPGGNESSCETGGVPSARGPVGGASSVLLGSDDSAAAFRLRQEERSAALDTPDAAPRFHQAPGGTSSISLGGGSLPVAPAVRGPVGGEATIILGTDGSEEALSRLRKAEQVLGAETPAPAPRFQQAPGGDASISLADAGTPEAPVADQLASAARREVGGPATVVLGVDDSAAILAQHAEQRQVVLDTPAAVPRFTQAPGGASTVLLAGGVPESARGAGVRCAPGGAATVVLGGGYPDDILAARASSSNAFARGSDQNCGNVLTERSSTRLHQAPGGTTTICLGGDDAPAPAERPSANHFAKGTSQNTGNVLTERSTTRLHHAPGGASTLCLGGDYPEAAPTKAAPKRLHQAPGGNSTLRLGDEAKEASSKEPCSGKSEQQGLAGCDENLDTSNAEAIQPGKDATKAANAQTAPPQLSGPDVVLG